MKPKPKPKPQPVGDEGGGFTKTQIEAMLKAGTWWPFTRVDAGVLAKVHRAMKKPNQPTDEEALL